MVAGPLSTYQDIPDLGSPKSMRHHTLCRELKHPSCQNIFFIFFNRLWMKAAEKSLVRQKTDAMKA
jgi:hypothetical protein